MMPIRPENAAYYRSARWLALREEVRARAGGACECEGECGDDHDGRCAAPHGASIVRGAAGTWTLADPAEQVGEIASTVVVLTVAHLDHNDFEATPDRCRHLCQRCHNRLDAPHRQRRAAQTRRERGGQATLPGVDP